MNRWKVLAAALIGASAVIMAVKAPKAESSRTSQFEEKGGIEGSVASMDKTKSIPGVTIVLHETGRPAADEGTRFTDSCGRFTFYPIEPGEYVLRAYYSNVVVVCKPLRLAVKTEVGSNGKEWRHVPDIRVGILMPEAGPKTTRVEQDCVVPE